MEPGPEHTSAGAYGGNRLTAQLEALESRAFSGRAGRAARVDGAGVDSAEILDAIAGQSDWMFDLLTRLVRVPTTLGNEEPGQQVMEAAIRELGLHPVDVPMNADELRAHPHAAPFDWDVSGKRNIVSEWLSTEAVEGQSLILNGHIDVVSPEPTSHWDGRDPFEAQRDGDWMVGRGTADMKCGLAAIVGAVRGLRSLGLAPLGNVTIESVVEEECTGNGTLQTLMAGYTADAAVIAEPFGAAITTSQVGVMWFTVSIAGVSGHAAEAGNSTNAIEESLAVIGALRALEAELNASPPAPYDLFDHPIDLNVGTISGGDWPSSMPGECQIGFRIAMYPATTIEDIRNLVETAVARATVDRVTASVSYKGFSSRGYDIRDDHALVSSLARSFAVQAGTPPALVATTGTTDAGVFGNVGGIPAVCFGPYAEGAHGVGERVYLPSVVQTAQVLGLFVRDWCGLA